MVITRDHVVGEVPGYVEMDPTSLPELPKNLPGPREKIKNLLYRNQCFAKQIKTTIINFLINSLCFLKTVRFYTRGFWLFPGVLEGLGSSGRLVGSISTYPGTSPTTWSRVMTKNLGEDFFYRPRYS